MKKIALGFVLLFGSQICIGQSSSSNGRPLTLGDSVPDIQFNNIIHSNLKKLSLSQLKGKAILLDFWSTWCTPCIALFPELDSLQKEFKENLVIIAVTRQKKEQVAAFLKKKPSLQKLSIFIATDASDVLKLFPHGSIPHEVWINKQQIVQAITSDEYITPANIQSFVKGESFPFIHKDENLTYNYQKPLIENALTNLAGKELYRSIFYTHIPGLRTSQNFHKTDSSYFLTLLNQTILQLYRHALPGTPSNLHRKTILEVKNLNQFVYNEQDGTQNYDEWKLANTFSYEVISKTTAADSIIKAKMLQDLNSHFKLNGRLEKRTGTLYKLVYNGKGKRPLKTTGASNAIEWADKGEEKKLYNKQIRTLIDFLNGASTSRKDIFEFVDETGLQYNIDISLNLVDIGDTDVLATQLKTYGLVLIKEDKEMEAFVLRER